MKIVKCWLLALFIVTWTEWDDPDIFQVAVRETKTISGDIYTCEKWRPKNGHKFFDSAYKAAKRKAELEEMKGITNVKMWAIKKGIR